MANTIRTVLGAVLGGERHILRTVRDERYIVKGILLSSEAFTLPTIVDYTAIWPPGRCQGSAMRWFLGFVQTPRQHGDHVGAC